MRSPTHAAAPQRPQPHTPHNWPTANPTCKVHEVHVLLVAAPQQLDRLAQLVVAQRAAHEVAQAAQLGQLEAAVVVRVELCV